MNSNRFPCAAGALLAIAAVACSGGSGGGASSTPGAMGGQLGSGGAAGSSAQASGGTAENGGLVGSGGTSAGGASASSGSAGTGASGSPGGSGGSAAGNGGTGRAGSGGAAAAGSGGTAGNGGVAGTGGAPSMVGATKSAGCGKAPTLTGKTQPFAAGFGVGGRYTMQSGGQSRSFLIRLPDNYDMNHPYWLIFGFHWNGGLADDVDSGGTSKYEFSYYGLQKQSKNGAIFVAPQGIGNGWANSGGRDLTFTDDMVKLIQEDLCVDTTHIISTGFSYGGGMSYELACARAKVFHGVVLYEGGQLSGCDGGNDPIGYMQLAGETDTVLGIAGARTMRDRFVKNNGCTAQNPPEPPQGSLTHICTSYSGCSAGHPVRWCAHGSGHTPAPVDGSSSLTDGINTWTQKDVWAWLTSF